jgi:hypothetical protein
MLFQISLCIIFIKLFHDFRVLDIAIFENLRDKYGPHINKPRY